MPTTWKASLPSILLISLVPVLASLFFVAIGTITGYLLTTNVVVALVSLCMLIYFVFITWRGNLLKTVASIFSLIFIGLLFGYLGENQLRIFLYDAEILFKDEQFLKTCFQQGGVLINQSILHLCKKYDFGEAGFVDLIVYFQGDASSARVFHDIYLGNVAAKPKDDLIKLGGIWPGSFITHHLIGNYYLIKVSLIGGP